MITTLFFSFINPPSIKTSLKNIYKSRKNRDTPKTSNLALIDRSLHSKLLRNYQSIIKSITSKDLHTFRGSNGNSPPFVFSTTKNDYDLTFLEFCLDQCSINHQCSLVQVNHQSLDQITCKLVKVSKNNYFGDFFEFGLIEKFRSSIYVFDEKLTEFLSLPQVMIGRNLTDVSNDEREDLKHRIEKFFYRTNVIVHDNLKIEKTLLPVRLDWHNDNQFHDPLSQYFPEVEKTPLILPFHNLTKTWYSKSYLQSTKNDSFLNSIQNSMLTHNSILALANVSVSHELTYKLSLDLDFITESACVLTFLLSKPIEIHEINSKYSRNLDCLKILREVSYASRFRAEKNVADGKQMRRSPFSANFDGKKEIVGSQRSDLVIEPLNFRKSTMMEIQVYTLRNLVFKEHHEDNNKLIYRPAQNPEVYLAGKYHLNLKIQPKCYNLTVQLGDNELFFDFLKSQTVKIEASILGLEYCVGILPKFKYTWKIVKLSNSFQKEALHFIRNPDIALPNMSLELGE